MRVAEPISAPWKAALFLRFQREQGKTILSEKHFEGPYVLGAAPNERDAHDDYADSLAIACSLTTDLTMPTIEVSNAQWLR